MLAYQRIRLVLPLLAACLCFGGCSPRRHGQPQIDSEEPLAITHPAAGDTVAGEVRVEAAVRTSAPPHRLVFSAGEVPIDTLLSPPWATMWSADAPLGGGWKSIGLEAQIDPLTEGAPPEIIRSRPLLIWVWPDSAPKVTISFPWRTPCIERKLGLALAATAEDPEDGPLAAESITWKGTRLSRPLTGASLPLDCLPDGRQAVTAEAADRWGRKGWQTLSLCPFRYKSGTDPPDCLDNLANGLQSLDSGACTEQIDSAFVFIPCFAQAAAAGWDRIWVRPTFERYLRDWLDGGRCLSLELDWTAGRVSTWTSGGLSWGWIELRGIDLRMVHQTTDPSGSDRVGSTGGGASVLLLRRPGGPWRIRQWRDSPPAKGPGLALLLAEAGGLPKPQSGIVCGAP